MKNIRTGLITVALMLVASSAFADNASGGAYVGGGIGLYNGSIKISNAGAYMNLGTSSTDAGLNLYGGYKFIMGKGSIAGEVSYNSGIGKDASINVPGVPSIVATLKMTDNYSVSVMPGYNLTQDTTSYLRLGYTRAKGEMTYPTPGSHTFNGYVVGFGVDQAVSPNLSARLEYRMLDFSSYTDTGATTSKPRASGMDLTVRYAF